MVANGKMWLTACKCSNFLSFFIFLNCKATEDWLLSASLRCGVVSLFCPLLQFVFVVHFWRRISWLEGAKVPPSQIICRHLIQDMILILGLSVFSVLLYILWRWSWVTEFKFCWKIFDFFYYCFLFSKSYSWLIWPTSICWSDLNNLPCHFITSNRVILGVSFLDAMMETILFKQEIIITNSCLEMWWIMKDEFSTQVGFASPSDYYRVS